MPTRLRRRGQHSPRPLRGDEILVAHGVVGDGEFEHPIEHHPAAAGAAAVEAEHELIQVAGQVRVVHRALVGLDVFECLDIEQTQPECPIGGTRPAPPSKSSTQAAIDSYVVG